MSSVTNMSGDNGFVGLPDEQPLQQQAPREEPLKHKIMKRGAILVVFLIVCWVIVIYDKLAPQDRNLEYHNMRTMHLRILTIVVLPVP